MNYRNILKLHLSSTLMCLISCSLFFIQCQKEKDEIGSVSQTINNITIIDGQDYMDIPVSNSIIFPIGQLNQRGSYVETLINDSVVVYDTINDGLGGYWAAIPYESIKKHSTLTIRITRKPDNLYVSELLNDTTKAFLKSSRQINWKTPGIINKSKDLFDSTLSRMENAKVMHEFVNNHVKFDESFSDAPAAYSASLTNTMEIGVCINFSRLFIALARASGIPSRSVSGIVFVPGSSDGGFFHHQWCEYLDENNIWKSNDPTRSNFEDLEDFNYIPLTYCAEETELFAKYYTNFMMDLGKPFKTDKNCTVLFTYLPIQKGARFGFTLKSKNLNTMVLEKTIAITKIDNNITLPKGY